MKDYNSLKYEPQRMWIGDEVKRNQAWENIKFGKGNCEEDLLQFLEYQCKFNHGWDDITVEDWYALVELEMKGIEELQNMNFVEKGAVIGGSNEINQLYAPKQETTNWQKYKKMLLEVENFSIEDVKAIERSSERILKHMNADTKGTAVKGLVVGNVQSGKTANMAALMAMAADNGWNMFIVLSGTIDKLRIQTSKRLISNLQQEGMNFNWVEIPHPSKKNPVKSQSCDFSKTSKNKYLSVCLKHSTRLKDLIQWLHEDVASTNQMKIMIIDDESDQASVNTKKMQGKKEDEIERTKINKLLINLVNNKNEKGLETNGVFKAINYIAYTATPYANLLNEAYVKSLYPHDFIATLQASKSYFGPQQIFGDRVAEKYAGLNVIRTIPKEDITKVSDIHKGQLKTPEKLEEAICWFLCCAACFRVWQYKKSVSMLIHTSNKQANHDCIHAVVEKWFKNDKTVIIDKCKVVWEHERHSFSKIDLFNEYVDFATPKEAVRDYPEFEKLTPHIQELIERTSNIMMDEEGDLNYSKNVHLCIDNCKYKGVFDDGTHMRLTYPDKSIDLGYSPAFIIIGGETLSRGLTLEGLVSTFFLRSSKQADSLMQMGRWFGYRRGYELLQRIWLSENTRAQFDFLSDLDGELRSNIADMEALDKKPSEYAVIIKNTPALNFVRISSPNKMQGAEDTKWNYSGVSKQTQLLYSNEEILKSNYNIAENFINGLGKEEYTSDDLSKGLLCGSKIWTDVKFETIYENLLGKMELPKQLRAFSDKEALREWVNKVTEKGNLKNWNVILYGLNKCNNGQAPFDAVTVNKVQRSRKEDDRNELLNIKIMTDPREKIMDIDFDKLNNGQKKRYEEYCERAKGLHIRDELGMAKTPVIIMYIIDKGTSTTGLRAEHDAIGLSIHIPGDKINNSYSEAIKIDLEKYGLGVDLQGEDIDEN